MLKGIVVAVARAEAVTEVLVVFVIDIGLLRVDIAARIRLVIRLQYARAGAGKSLGTAVAGEVALLEDLDERVLAVALDRAGIADACRRPRIGVGSGRGVACQARENTLLQRTEDSGAVIDAL